MKESVENIPLESTQTFNAEFLRNYIYLFLFDIVHLKQETYQDYVDREPGCDKTWLNAYTWAFAQQINHSVSHAVLQGIHKIVMGHLPSVMPGRYNSDCRYIVAKEAVVKSKELDPADFLDNLSLSSPTEKKADEAGPIYKYIGESSISQKGLFEYVQRWIISETYPFHGLEFHASFTEKPSYTVLPWKEGQHYPTFLMKFLKKGENVKLTPFSSSHWAFLKNLVLDDDYRVELSMSPVSKNTGYKNKLALSLTLKKLDEANSWYNKKILLANNPTEKLAIILLYLQKINQNHPNIDGNIRRCYILLNRLSREEGLPFSILINPNRFDCFSLEELMNDVIAGQQLFLNLCQGIPQTVVDPFTQLDYTDDIKPMPLTHLAQESDEFLEIAKINFQSVQGKLPDYDLANLPTLVKKLLIEDTLHSKVPTIVWIKSKNIFWCKGNKQNLDKAHTVLHPVFRDDSDCEYKYSKLVNDTNYSIQVKLKT